jgi:hypothetical protein
VTPPAYTHTLLAMPRCRAPASRLAPGGRPAGRGRLLAQQAGICASAVCSRARTAAAAVRPPHRHASLQHVSTSGVLISSAAHAADSASRLTDW